jgi:L-malate glycosyltransferase
MFLRQGFHGIGDDAPDVGRLEAQLDGLLVDATRRKQLGEFGRQVAETRFSLQRAVGLQLQIYEQVARKPPRWNLSEVLISAARALRLEIDNHDPRRKRRSRLEQEHLFAMARRGRWPPVARA